jgi:uncharacterized delta-60 repeat protein
VFGRILDETNNPVSEATITFELNFQGTLITRTTTTNNNGNYAFAGSDCQNSVKIMPSKVGYTFSPQSANLISSGCINENATRNFLGHLSANSLVDSSFGPGVDDRISALAIQSDGKILVGGSFKHLGGGSTGTVPRSGIARLNTDGTVDPDFNPGTDGPVTAIAVQADGKILVGGFITRLGGGGSGVTAREHIGRLNQDGTLDESFNPGADAAVWAFAVQPDGKIVVVGNFHNLGGGTGVVPRKYIGRLNNDGTVDLGFHPGANGGVENVLVQPDGKILVAGNFTTIGAGGSGTTPRIGIARLNADGTLDLSFDPGSNSKVTTFALQPDGKILVGGTFTRLGGGDRGHTTRNYIGRLNADGTVDPTFNPGANIGLQAIALQADGRILVGGDFTTLGGGGTGTTVRNHIGRLHPDGTLDLSFDPGANDFVSALTLQEDGKILVVGFFNSLGSESTGSATRNFIGRLNNTEVALQSLSSSPNGTTLQWFRSQASPEVARVTFEFSTDGLTYSALGNGWRTPDGWQLTGLTLPTQQDILIRARGFYATGDRNASESIAESVVAVNTQSSSSPSVTSLSPSSAVVGDQGFILTVIGTGFVTDAVISINGLDRPANFIDTTQLTTQVQASELAAVGTLSVTLTNFPSGATSNPVYFNVNHPIPTITSVSPDSKRTGDASFDLTVNGTNFNYSSLVCINGAIRPATLINSSQVVAQVTAADVAIAGLIPITVFNPTPGGGMSNVFSLLVSGPGNSSARDGFDPGANGTVSDIALQADGKILLGGVFTTIGEGGTGTTPRNHLARLNVDGTLDLTFDPGTNGFINALVVLPDGKILVGGNFSTLGGGGTGTTTQNFIGRLNTDGTIDSTFNLATNGAVLDFAVQSDGKVLMVGNFTALTENGLGTTTRKFIARLNADGTLDQSFNPGADGGVEVVAIQADSKIVVSGNFNKLGGGTGTTTRNFIGRLNPDGTLDTSFDPGMNNKAIAVEVQPDGKILLGGNFSTLGGGGFGNTPRNRIGRLNSDGTVDPSFDPGANSGVFALAIQADGKILVGGVFTTLGGGGSGTIARNRIARLNPDGTLDLNFDPGANIGVSALAVQADNKILVGGGFTTLGGGGSGTIPRSKIARLNSDGSVDQTLDGGADGIVRALAVQPDGRILVGGSFTTLGGAGSGSTTRNYLGRLKPDGTLDASFDPGANGTVSAIAVQPDGKILVAGSFTALGGGGTGNTTRNHIGRLNPDGTLDTTFDPGADETVIALALQPDGKILLAGSFTTLGGGGTGTNNRNYLGRLNADGTLDPSFAPIVGGSVLTVAIQPDDKILVGGAFEHLGVGSGSSIHKHIGRLNADGTIDASFVTATDMNVRTIGIQTDGKILLGGNFQNIVLPLSGDGTTTTWINYLARLNTDGTVDTGFDPGANNPVETIALQADGKILIGGFFTTLGGGGTGTAVRNHIGRLNSDGTLDASFDPGANNFVAALGIQADGKILAAGGFTTLGEGGTGTAVRNFIGRITNIEAALQSVNGDADGATLEWLRGQTSPEVSNVTFEHSQDGLTFSLLGKGSRIPGGWRLTGLTLPTDQNFYVRARGFYSTGYENGSGSIVDSVKLMAKPAILDPPNVSTLLPSNVMAGSPGFTLTVDGTGFLPSFVIRINGVDRTTTFVDSMHLTTMIDAAEIALAGTLSVRVFDPDPNGGLSDPKILMVNNPMPVISRLEPATITAGGPEFTLAVNGSNFVPGSVVRFNGSDRTTAFVSSSQLTINLISTLDARTYPINVLNSGPGGGVSNTVTFAVNPFITSILPTRVRAGDGGFTLMVNGAGFGPTTVARFNGVSRSTSFVNPTQLNVEILPSDIAINGSYPITVVTSPADGSLLSDVVNLEVLGPTSLKAFDTSGSSNSTISVPIQVTAQGDENALNFSLTFDPALLLNNPVPQVTLGNGVSAETLTIDPSQIALGRLGVSLILPTGQTFAAGTQQLINVTFATAAVVTQSTSILGFGDLPAVRQISNPSGQTLTAVYTPATITIAPGYEADVSPRPSGNNNGTISISDWVQAGRFAAGLDIANPGTEFQRADCAPRESLGNGAIGVSDWVQAGRYVAGLDPVTAAGGPTVQAQSSLSSFIMLKTTLAGAAQTNSPDGELRGTSRIHLVSQTPSDRQTYLVSVELEAQGHENGLGFSLLFDPERMSFVSAGKGLDIGASPLNVNQLKAAKGRIGLALALPPGAIFARGRHQLAMLTFKLRSDSSDMPPIGFVDLPIAREVVDLNANQLKAVFYGDTATNPLDATQFFVLQHYLDFLGRTPDSEGLEYWSEQIRKCGPDKDCVNQRRIDISAAFFMEPEFQQTGSFIYHLYMVGLGRQVTYDEFVLDRGQLIGGPILNARKSAFANAFVEREEFVEKHKQFQTAEVFVDNLLNELRESSQIDLTSNRSRLIGLHQASRNLHHGRSLVLQAVIGDGGFRQAEYNRSFVLMEYFAYLQRDPDKDGFTFWLSVLNNGEPDNYRGMVCSFLTSREYQQRFGSQLSYSNSDCRY